MAAALGFVYPQGDDERVTHYLQRVSQLPPDATEIFLTTQAGKGLSQSSQSTGRPLQVKLGIISIEQKSQAKEQGRMG